MRDQTIYVLHEYGAASHYIALQELCKQNNINIEYRIFDPISLLRNFYHKRFRLFFQSVWFLVSLPFIHQKKIVLAIAPFNKLLIPISLLLRRHKVYYHTSYSCWDGTIMAHPTSSSYLKNFWYKYISTKILHIFAVSQKTKDELIKNRFSKSDKISVVNHSFNTLVSETPLKKDNSFIYVGRLTESKGISELLDIFSKRPEAEFTIVGHGELGLMVHEYTKKYKNIKYLGYIRGLQNIIPIYQRHSFLVLNSHRTRTWEELFGITIIEGMACGCIPLTTDHPGPKEIITNGVDGYITKESNIEALIDNAIQMSDKRYQAMRLRTVETGNSYHCSQMSSKWNKILIP